MFWQTFWLYNYRRERDFIKYTLNFMHLLPIKVVRDHFTYLGFRTSRNPKSLSKLNFVDWKILLSYVILRIFPVKTITLPKFSYLFQHLPIVLTQFRLILLPVVRAYKSHHICKAHLQKHADVSGLDLPIFRHNYRATSARGRIY